MSVVIETFLICDGNCGTNFGVDNRSQTAYTHRKHAKKEEWVRIGSKDFCDVCANDKELFQRIKHTL